MMNKRFLQQLEFLYEIDKLKTVFRQTSLIADVDRFENSAEHSWHLAFYAIILCEYANESVNVLRVLKMVLLHDLVEIDAGDTFCYDIEAHHNKEYKEKQAALRLFGMLPTQQKDELLELWEEFEAGETMDAKFAVSVDRLQPLLHNYMTDGRNWKRHNIIRAQVEKRMVPVARGSKILADLIEKVLDDAVARKMLHESLDP